MNFSYKARTEEGKVQKGTIEASNRQTALDILEKYGFYATVLKQQRTKGLFSKSLVIGREVPRKDLVLFTRQVGTMMKSAIAPLESFRAQVVQIDNPRFRTKILKIAEAIERGSTLSQAFSLFPKVFNPFFISIIKAGEAAGKVADSLDYLSNHLEEEYNFNQKVKGAMFYPLFVIVVFMGSMLVVLFFIVPKLTVILESFNPEDLPFLTKGLIALGGFIKKGGWIVIIVVLGLMVGSIPFLLRSKKVRRWYDRVSLRAPMLGDFYKKIQLSRFAENLSVLISAGLPIIKALTITKDIMSNSVYKDIVKKAEEAVTRGEKISGILSAYPKQFPSFVTQMVLTGEKTGRLDKTLMDMVRFYKGEIERTTEKLTTMLEPILILALGIGIAILAFAVFIPLFNVGMGGMG